MLVYQVSREFYPFASAGGLKEVVTGVATSLINLGHSSSVFIPLYGFIDKNSHNIKKVESFELNLDGKPTNIKTYKSNYKGVSVYMFEFDAVSNKSDVYTYTFLDEKNNKEHKKGFGFLDSDRINIIFQLAFLNYVYKFLPPPDVLSLHDGHTGLIPSIIKSNTIFSKLFFNSKIFFTIHNAGHIYHQKTPVSIISKYKIIKDELLKPAIFEGELDPLCLASLNSNTLTVSPFYAEEILDLKHEEISDYFGKFCINNNIKINGITNGVNIDHYKKLNITGLPNREIKESFKFELSQLIKSSNEIKIWGSVNLIDRPLFIFQNRVTEQKGVDKLIKSIEKYIEYNNISQFIIMGQGELIYENKLIDLALSSKGNVCYLQGYNELIANKLFIASDFFILTSLWEPCGLTDFEAQLAGSIPIVNKTGGLQKVINEETGFVYNLFEELKDIILQCEKLFFTNSRLLRKMQIDAFFLIKEEYTWNKVVETKYIPLFKNKL